jgi:uncharacterized membrane protein YdjX (TVP38/TMEM64 family)
MSAVASWFRNHGSLLYKIVVVLVLAATAAGIIYLGLNRKLLEKGLEEVKKLGLWGNCILVVCYVVVAFPVATGYTIICLACGFLYGILIGPLTTQLGIAIGSSISYWLCGTLCKDWVAKKISANKKTEALQKAVRRHSFKIVFLSRLTPIPYGLQNALFGVSGINFFWYILATILGMLPEAFLWCYFGSKIHEVTDVIHGNKEFGTWQKVFLGAQIGAVILLVMVLGFFGRRAMRKAAEEETQDPEVSKGLLSGPDVENLVVNSPEPTTTNPSHSETSPILQT